MAARAKLKRRDFFVDEHAFEPGPIRLLGVRTRAEVVQLSVRAHHGDGGILGVDEKN